MDQGSKIIIAILMIMLAIEFYEAFVKDWSKA